ncbi:hypothetical protein FRB96_000262 [Tulasnella sp. 330]|nr:hypothetical protein FRB96_000262 [Tulasnella sp. 330]KAG8889792.1 hypothetical protein FRB98_002714 [Tulasnella sp. 332]
MSGQTLPWTSYENSTYCYSAPDPSNDEYYPEPQLQFSTSSSLSSGSGSPADMMNQRSPSPVDARTKNARAQARHRAKRKAYIENLEASVRQLRIAVTSGLSPQAAAQAQLLERENARLRAEAQYLRSQLGANVGPLTAPMSSSWNGPSQSTTSQNGNTERTPGVRLPNMAGTLGAMSSTRTSPSPSSYAGQPRLRTAYSAENLRINRKSPENRLRRAAPYALVGSMRRDVQRQSSSQSDYQYTPRQFQAQETETSGSLDGSPYVQQQPQSPRASSYSSSTIAEALGHMNPPTNASANTSTNAAYSYSSQDNQNPQYHFQHQDQYREHDEGTVYSETAIIAPQAQPGYPPLSDYTASTFGLCAPQYSGPSEDVKPLVR